MTETIRAGFTVLALAVAVVPLGASAQVEVVAYLPGMLLGRGYDNTTGSVRSDCLTHTQRTEPLTAIGSTSFEFSELTSNSDVFSMTNIDASASGNVGLFSASAEFGLLTQNEISNFDANFMARVNVQKSWDYTQGEVMKPEKLALASENPEQFVQACGNRYIAGVLRGGEFYGLIVVSTTSQTDKATVTAAVNASYGAFSASTTVKTETAATLASHQTRIQGYMTGSGSQAIPLTIQQMQARAANYPAEIVQSGGAPIAVLLLEYPVYDAPALTGAMYQLASLRWDYVTVKKEVQYVLDHPSEFYMSLDTWKTFLEARRTEAQAAITKVSDALTSCGTQAETCQVPAGLRTPDQLRGDLPPRYMGSCSGVNLTGLSTSNYPLSGRCGGDSDIHGHNPSIRVESKVVPVSNGGIVNVESYVKIREGKEDWTCFQGTTSRTVLNVALDHPGCYLRAASDVTPSTGLLTASGGSDNHAFTDYSTGTGLISHAKCRSDTKGKDTGRLGCNPIDFSPLVLKLTNEERRMGPNDLKRSAVAVWANRAVAVRRMGSLATAATARFLEPFRAFRPMGVPVTEPAGLKLQRAEQAEPADVVPTFRPRTGAPPLPR